MIKRVLIFLSGNSITIFKSFCLLFFICYFMLKSTYAQTKKNSTCNFGLDFEYTNRSVNEIGGGLNLMYMPDWNRKRNIIYALSYNTYWLFSQKNNWGNRLNIDLLLYKKERKYFLLPNIGSFIELQNIDNLNSGLRIGLNWGTLLYLNYQYTLPLNQNKIQLVSQNSISLTLKLNSTFADFGYYSKW